MKSFTLFGTDNVYYILLASVISVFGLITNSKELLIGAMLISPMFVPVINANILKTPSAITNNTIILVLEIISAVLVGYIASKLFKKVETKEMENRTKWDDSPTNQAINTWMIPLIGGPVAAIAIKSNDIAPTLGVGIALAFLPPLVNAGMYWGYGEKEKAIKSFKLALYNIVLSAITFTITFQYF